MPGSTQRKRVAAAKVAIAVSLPFFGLVPLAAAHVDQPTVTALHAFIGDPLFGLDTSEGSLFETLPDERTAMASTTKLMTLHLTALALDDGVVALDDPVTVSALAASKGGSSMDDVNGTPLEVGEVVSLEGLIRGMMYPSGNNASWAIAEHVAEAYGGPNATAQDFINLMNQHATADGLSDTNFTSPNGYDDPFQQGVTPKPEELNHYTTARELSELMAHAIPHPYFQQVVGFTGTFNVTTQGPNGPKMYALNFPFFGGYPGWEGAKGGGTQNCNGPNNGCMAMSAKRIGRRVVLAFMQGQPWTEEVGMFDYAFATIFHPDPRGSSGEAGVPKIHDTDCLPGGRAVSAVLPESGPVILVSWEPDIDNSIITTLDEETLPKSGLPPKGDGEGAGPDGDVAVANLPIGDLVLGSRKGSSVELSLWSMAGSGALSLLDDGTKAGPATTMDLQSVYGDMFLTAVTDPDGALVLKSWQLDGSGLTKLDTYRDESRVYSEVVMSGPLTTDVFTGHRAVTAVIAPNALVHDVWGVDQTTGEISLLGELVEAGIRENVEISPFHVNTVFEGELFPPVYYATAFRFGGLALIRFYRIAATGTPVSEGSIGTTVVSPEDIEVAPLGVGGVMSATRDSAGEVQLMAWDTRRNADNSISPDLVSEHEAPDAGSLDFCRVPSTHADGDYVTPVTDPLSGELRLRAYRSGDRPF